MSDALTFPTGAPLWMELSTSDPAAAQAFYTGLFGWTADEKGPEYGNYVAFESEGKMVGGMMGKMPGQETPDAWLVYLESDDVATTATAVRDAEGDVYAGPMDVMTLGRMLVAADRDGATVGAWERGDNKGFEAVARVGAPAWFELHTTKFYDEVEFYQQAFGWETATMADTPEFKYVQLMVDGQPYAGVMDASAYWAPGAPAQWMVYVCVADTDTTVATAVSLGGEIVDAAEDTPFGRLATIKDPTGALIKLIQTLDEAERPAAG